MDNVCLRIVLRVLSMEMFFFKYLTDICSHACMFNSLAPNNAYMRLQSGSLLDQKMMWRPVGTNPYSEPRMTTCYLEHGEESTVKEVFKFDNFH